jgi:hypothetical protein
MLQLTKVLRPLISTEIGVWLAFPGQAGDGVVVGVGVGPGVGDGLAAGDGVVVALGLGMGVGVGAGVGVGVGVSVGDGEGTAAGAARAGAGIVTGADGAEAGPRQSPCVGTTVYTTCCPAGGESWHVRKGAATLQIWTTVVLPRTWRLRR